MLLRALLVVVASSSIASAQELPHAFPRDGAVEVLDNERVTIWDVTWIKGKPSPMHRHRYDLVGVYFVGSEIEITMPDGRAMLNTMEPGDVIFQPKDVTHIEAGTDEANPRRAILIDLKDTAPAPVDNPTTLPSAFPREGATKRLENDRVVIWDYRWTPGVPTAMHFHDRESVVVLLEDGALRATTPEGEETMVEMVARTARFSTPGRAHAEELVRGTGRAIVVELK